MHYCGRTFTVPEIELIRALIASDPPPSRYQLSRAVCEHLGWRRPDGHLKDMSCRVALLRMQADGLLTLPEPRRKRPGMFTLSADLDSRVCPPPFTTRVDLDHISIEPVAQRGDSRLWNAYVERHHYLGHELIPGAQLRYFVRCAGDILALLSFGASAWKIKPRDAFIGWSDARRREKLHLIVNNARFLILPRVSCRNLASRILALVSRRLPQDWLTHYGYRPVLLETFVEKTRFTGTCYKASNWLYLGDTQGRGKLDTLHRRGQPIKSIWVYPLTRNFRRQLCNA